MVRMHGMHLFVCVWRLHTTNRSPVLPVQSVCENAVHSFCVERESSNLDIIIYLIYLFIYSFLLIFHWSLNVSKINAQSINISLSFGHTSGNKPAVGALLRRHAEAAGQSEQRGAELEAYRASFTRRVPSKLGGGGRFMPPVATLPPPLPQSFWIRRLENWPFV